jgi:hypothetical protein
MTFKQFVEQKEAKPWIAKKADVLQLWNTVRADAQIQVRPVSKYHKGNRFDQDGIRITGTSAFINSVLGKLKSLLFYSDHPSLELDVKYRQVMGRSTPDQPSFACYINVVEKKKN